MSTNHNISDLFQKYLENQCTPEESKQVLDWLATENYDQEHKAAISQLLTQVSDTDRPASGELKQQLEKNLEIILQKIGAGQVENTETGKVKRLPWYRWAAAAVLIVTISCTIFFLSQNKTTHTENLVVNNKPIDIAPGSNKAILVLDDGTKVILEDASNGHVAQQGSSSIIKNGDKLTYNETGKQPVIVYNTIATPKGGQYQLTLADGSKIWLNSASSIRFPVAFTATDRKVEITGEVYFEVAKNTAKPFVVAFTTPGGKKSEVTVLGTRFNVMTYADEDVAKTTLLEGSVRIACNGNTALLTPGQQAKLQSENMKVLNNVNVEEVTAWKDGFFQFNATNIQQVMRQLARWYDVDIVYEGNIPQRKFGGKIPMESNLSEVLKILKATNIKFKIEEKKIIVK